MVRLRLQWPLVATHILIHKLTFLTKLLANTDDIISSCVFTSLAIVDVYNNDQIDSSFSTNRLLAQMPSTVHLYHMLQIYGIHSLRGSSLPHLVLLKPMLCVTYD